MATTPDKKKEAAGGFVYLPLIAGWLVPGAGHFLLRKWGRGALLSASILAMFVLGLTTFGLSLVNTPGIVISILNGALLIVSIAAPNLVARVLRRKT